jgi:phosphate transport system substrate-binding protein
MRSLPARLVLPLLLLFGCGRTPPPDNGSGGTTDVPAASLNAGGATFVQPIMKVWTDEFRDKTGDKVKINYQGTGSSDGIGKLTNKEYAFGCSDAPMNQKELDTAKAKGDVLHVPLVVGGVVPVYNLDGIDKPLAFTGPVLADIFLGTIKKWNDPKLAALNKGVNLPDLDIQPVFRSEGSGTSYIFTEYLSKVSEDFKAKVGATKSFPDKVGVGKKGSDGVAGHITTTKGAIGYIELTYALDTKAKYGSVRNKAGKDILADGKSLTAAAAAGMKEKQTGSYALHDLTYNLTEQAGDDVYPIAATSFCLLYKKQQGDTGKALVTFLKWATGKEGQGLSEKRNYAALPDDLQKKIADALAGVTFE